MVHSQNFGQNFDLKIRRDNNKNCYERRVGESVDDNSLYSYISKTDKKKELMQQRIIENSLLVFNEGNKLGLKISILYLPST